MSDLGATPMNRESDASMGTELKTKLTSVSMAEPLHGLKDFGSALWSYEANVSEKQSLCSILSYIPHPSR